MTAIDFPNSPTVGQLFTVGETTWEWTGVLWEGSSVAIPGPQGPTGPTGATGSTGPAGPGIASGGTASQILTKASGADYDTQWSTLPRIPPNDDTAKGIGYIGLPQVQVTSSKTFSNSDAGKHQRVDNAVTLTIPSNASVPFEIGTTFIIINNGNFSTTVAIDSDTLRLAGSGTTGSRTLGNYGMATIVKIKDEVWVISGNGLS